MEERNLSGEVKRIKVVLLVVIETRRLTQALTESYADKGAEKRQNNYLQ